MESEMRRISSSGCLRRCSAKRSAERLPTPGSEARASTACVRVVEGSSIFLLLKMQKYNFFLYFCILFVRKFGTICQPISYIL